MSRRVKLQRRDGVALITLSALDKDGRRAGFDAPLRSALGEALALALSQSGTRAIVLRAEAGGWPVSGNVASEYTGLEAEGGGSAPGLSVLCAMVASAPVPVLTLLSGVMAGGALVLAQAADLRLAQQGCVFALREYPNGFLPGGGLITRLARRVGAERAIAAICGGAQMEAAHAMKAGLCDAVIDAGALESAATTVALEVAQGKAPGLPDPRAGLADIGAFFDQIEAARSALSDDPLQPVMRRLIDVVEASALLPEDEAISFENVACAELLAEPLAKGLAYTHAARRQARVRLGGESGRLAEGRTLGLWNMGDRLALDLARQGYDLRVGAADAEWLHAAQERISHELARMTKAGQLNARAASALEGRLRFTSEPAEVGAAELVFARVSPRDPEGALGALRQAHGGADGVALAGAAPQPNEIGFSLSGRLREFSPGAQVSDEVLAEMAEALRRSGSVVVVGKGIAGRLEAACFAAAERCVLAGAMPDRVDAALLAYGFGTAPFVWIDALGLDAVLARLEAAHRAVGPYLSFLRIVGFTGRDYGQGIYRYAEGQPPVLAPETAETLAALRSEAGIVARPVNDAEIVARVMAELAGEGAAMLQDGTAEQAGDIDLVAQSVFRIAPHLGGPMLRADSEGALAMRKRLRALAEEGAPPPVALWDRLIREGTGF